MHCESRSSKEFALLRTVTLFLRLEIWLEEPPFLPYDSSTAASCMPRHQDQPVHKRLISALLLGVMFIQKYLLDQN
jgi:hypothetical protein